VTHDGPIHGEDAALEAEAQVVQRAVAKTATALARNLNRMGYEMVLVRLGKVVKGTGTECALPAATACSIEPRILGCLRLEAGELRRLADEFEAQCDESGAPEATTGYTITGTPEDFGL